MKRRTWLLGTAAVLGGGLAIGLFQRQDGLRKQAIALTDQAGGQLLGGWLRIAPDNTVTLYVPHSDMGQGVMTTLGMMVADELDIAWAQLRVAQAPAHGAFANPFFVEGFLLPGGVPQVVRPVADVAFGELARFAKLQVTGGSASVRYTGQRGLRVVAAAARGLLVDTAAKRWSVAPDALTVQDGVVTDAAGTRRATYGELAQEAAGRHLPSAPRLKTRAQFRLMGKGVPRLDIPDKVCGRARYGIDLQLPGLLVATVQASPVHGGRLAQVDEAPAMAVPGVKSVVRLPEAVAVVATGYWAAHRGMAALQPTFEGGDAQADSASAMARLQEALASADTETVVDTGSPTGTSERRHVASFEVPWLHHATMEPINVTAQWVDGRLLVWGSEQDALGAHGNLVKISGLPAEKVVFTPLLLGGGFGRRSAPKKNHLEQAVALARTCSPAPVKLIWSREEDFTQGAYRPAVVTTIEAAVDGQGMPLSWVQRFTETPDLINEGYPLHYRIGHQHIQSIATSSPVRVGAWRSVAHSQHGFFTESFVNELAQAARQDPLDYRLALLPEGSRHQRVLQALAEHSGWRQAAPQGVGRGVAMVESFGSVVGEVIEVALDDQRRPVVKRVVAVVDCGFLMHPDTGRQQVEGAILMGLSAALGEAITLKDGRVQQRNFTDYPILRLAQTPAIEVHFLESDGPLGGLGEVGLPPVAPALAQAWGQLTGQTIRRLPLVPPVQA